MWRRLWIKKYYLLRWRIRHIFLTAVCLLLALHWYWLLFLRLPTVEIEQEFDLSDLESLFTRLKQNYFNSFAETKNRTLKYGILVVSDNFSQLRYSQLNAALYCYAIRHDYIYNNLNPRTYRLCAHIPNFFFQKHCVVLHYLITHPSIGWLMVLDGDNVLVNESKRIEEFIPNVPNVYVVHSERFYNGEISAGNYLIYNCRWSYTYLYNWINMYRILPPLPYHNHDNGALHIHFAFIVGKLRSNCFQLWYTSINETFYDQFVGCIKCAIAGQRQFTHVWLLRRGHALTRDHLEPENKILETDFLIHGFKNHSSHYYQHEINTSVCQHSIASWSLPVRTKMLITNRTIAKSLIHYHDIVAQLNHPDSVGIADVHDCWPFCPANLTGIKEKAYLQALCKTNKSDFNV